MVLNFWMILGVLVVVVVVFVVVVVVFVVLVVFNIVVVVLSNSTPTCKPNSTSVGLSRS